MKILHVSDCFLPRLGGIEVQVGDLVRVQSEAGHEVEVATATPGAAHDRVPVHRITAPLPFELPVHPRGGFHLLRLFRRRRPDVVHCHVGAVSPFAWQGVRSAVEAGLPTVVTVHSMWDPATQRLYRTLDGLLRWTRWGVVATAVSEAAARPIRRTAGRGVPVHVVSNGLDLSQWRPEGEPPPPHEGVHVVAVGRLAPRKQPIGLVRLLDVARRGVPAAIPMRATIVGDGPARPAVERQVRARGLDGWVSLPGRLSREEIRGLLAEADVFVAPAPLESFGLAALEARTAGVPVVARESSGVADFVRHGREGLLASDLRGLGEAVARLARDGELRSRIAAHNRATEPSPAGWPAVLDGFERCYAEAAERALARARSGAAL
ncbi:glycosyltransferase family 4 protein [Bailinhaonella thermotolerans]|uniref:Glycosyltransferase family 1 protein n=1 Tax=Bailinhaonella thermotolerans TaxID=1070861 RepID=A0A3A4BEE5_9ACTN|nr:glycosyltransferase family 4 protein [Bailinhaonella thermotolerans]RJL32680.1 glycosyltransferase family 1 protein [Bailinhaonella thermotolerans]